MAFLAVMREGFETAVFLLATFQNSTNKAAGGIGALLGVMTAVAGGFVIYKGGLKINLSRFFKVTGVVLVVIAAGLVMSAFRTGHEAGWVTFGQGSTWNLDWLVHKGTPIESLITGVLGIQQQPTRHRGRCVLPLPRADAHPRSRPRSPAFAPSDSRDDRPHRRSRDPLDRLVMTQSANDIARSQSVKTVNTDGRHHRRPRVAAAALLIAGIGSLATACAKQDDDAAAKGAIKVEITDAGCEPSPASAESGLVSFAIANKGSAKATEAELKSADGKNVLGEKENLTDGLTGSFKLNLREGTYKMYCPGAKQDTWDFAVTKGTDVKDWKDNPELVAAVKGYSRYVEAQTADLATQTKKFTDAVRAGDIEKSKHALRSGPRAL